MLIKTRLSFLDHVFGVIYKFVAKSRATKTFFYLQGIVFNFLKNIYFKGRGGEGDLSYVYSLPLMAGWLGLRPWQNQEPQVSWRSPP